MTTIEDFHEQSQKYISNCFNNRHILELTKMCGYFEWTTIYNTQQITLYDLYEIAETHFQQTNVVLYVKEQTTSEWKKIPKDNTFFFTYINDNRSYFAPVYPVPANIVYKIYVNDHTHSNTDTNEPHTITCK